MQRKAKRDCNYFRTKATFISCASQKKEAIKKVIAPRDTFEIIMF